MTSSLIPEIRAFLKVIELGSFAGAAEVSGYTPSGISRMISRTEQRLGISLFYRSTRSLNLTPEGEVFLRYANEFITLEEASEAELSKTLGVAKGHLSINCGTAFARYKLSPILPEFIKKYPDITINLSVSDHRIDPIKKHVDITIRVGELEDSDLITIKLGSVKRIIAASPKYIENWGIPKNPSELVNHRCLLLSGFSKQATWPMIENGQPKNIGVKGPICSDSADILLHMAIEGAGIIRLGDFLGERALLDGRLVEIFANQHFTDPKPLSALIAPKRQNIPRVRAFIDFLKVKL